MEHKSPPLSERSNTNPFDPPRDTLHKLSTYLEYVDYLDRAKHGNYKESDVRWQRRRHQASLRIAQQATANRMNSDLETLVILLVAILLGCVLR